ncbi:hypothetical protein D3C73_1145980 [compost metagenome]
MSALREGGKAPDIYAHQTREDLGLGVAEHGKLCGEPLNRAVALAQLNAGQRGRQRGLGFNGMGRGNKAITAEGLRQRHCARRDVTTGGFHLGGVAALHVREAFFGILTDCVLAGKLLKAPECRTGNIQVIVA